MGIVHAPPAAIVPVSNAGVAEHVCELEVSSLYPTLIASVFCPVAQVTAGGPAAPPPELQATAPMRVVARAALSAKRGRFMRGEAYTERAAGASLPRDRPRSLASSRSCRNRRRVLIEARHAPSDDTE